MSAATSRDYPANLEEALRAVLDYLWLDEIADYQSSPRPGHIFLALKSIAEKIGYEDSANG